MNEETILSMITQLPVVAIFYYFCRIGRVIGDQTQEFMSAVNPKTDIQ